MKFRPLSAFFISDYFLKLVGTPLFHSFEKNLSLTFWGWRLKKRPWRLKKSRSRLKNIVKTQLGFVRLSVCSGRSIYFTISGYNWSSWGSSLNWEYTICLQNNSAMRCFFKQERSENQTIQKPLDRSHYAKLHDSFLLVRASTNMDSSFSSMT